ncbi:hypothetical protein [Nocardia sp. NPDC004711]
MTTEFFDALTAVLAADLRSGLEYAIKSGSGDWERFAAGVGRIISVTESLEPEYEKPAARAVEIAYLDRAGGERFHYLCDITVEELMRGTGVRVPDHKLAWTLAAEGDPAQRARKLIDTWLSEESPKDDWRQRAVWRNLREIRAALEAGQGGSAA